MDTLSDDILIHIFAQGTAKEISLWRRVSSTWNKLINDDFVWKRAFLNFWNNITPVSRKIESWKEEYLQRIETINDMSCYKPLAIRICTKKTEIQDISITNSSIKVLNFSGLTSAIIRSDGRLDQKFILFFENFFGEAPITFSKFLDGGSLLLGFADGSLVLFDKCPSKSLLLEEYKRIPPSLTSSPIKTAFLPFLTVHQMGNCHEFVNLTDKTILTVPNLKDFLFIEEVFKIIFITTNGHISICNMNNMKTKTLPNVHTVIINCHLLQVNCDWIVLSIENRILVINIDTEEIISSFTVQVNLTDLHLISSNSELIELLATSSDSQLLKLKINPIGNSLELEKIEIIGVLGLFVNEIFYILVTIDGIFVHDTLTDRLINKCSYPKYFLKYDNDDNGNGQSRVKISKLEGNKFLFIWGKSLAQIWNFSPKPSTSNRSKPASSSADKGLLGNKAIRKYSKYAVNSGIEDYQEEKREEDHLNLLRRNLNIEGLTEEELISYAKLLSQDSRDVNCDEDVNSVTVSDDPELEMALKLSLIEM